MVRMSLTHKYDYINVYWRWWKGFWCMTPLFFAPHPPFLQGSHRPSHLFPSRRQMKKPWRTRISGSFYGNLEFDLLQMSRRVFVYCSLLFTLFKWIHSFWSQFKHCISDRESFLFLGDLLENPSKDQRVAAPECSCSSDSSSRRSWWGWEAKRPPDRRIPGRGRGGRGGGGCRWTQSPGPACSAAGTKKEEPHLRSHRWAEVSHIFCGFSNDSS